MSHYNHEDPHPTGTIFSKMKARVTKRQIGIIKQKCKSCNHHKAIVNLSMRSQWNEKCARCKRGN